MTPADWLHVGITPRLSVLRADRETREITLIITSALGADPMSVALSEGKVRALRDHLSRVLGEGAR